MIVSIFLVLFLSCISHLDARIIKSSDSVQPKDNKLDSILKIALEPWTQKQIDELQKFLHVVNILDGDTIIGVLIANKNRCKALCIERFDLYWVFVRIIKQILLPWPHIVIELSALDYYALAALLLAGANPQPHFSIQEQYLWAVLQLYILSGQKYIPCLELLFDFGAQADFIAYQGACTAMNLSLWGFFWESEEEIVKILLENGANPNMLCPENVNPNFLEHGMNSVPRKTYIGFFVGYTPVDSGIISIIEQYYFYLVYDPHKGTYNRPELINSCQDIITLLSEHGGKASSKQKLQKKLDELLYELARFYCVLATDELKKIVTSYVEMYGT